MEAALRERLEALPPAARAELILVLRLPDFERADAIGSSHRSPIGEGEWPRREDIGVIGADQTAPITRPHAGVPIPRSWDECR